MPSLSIGGPLLEGLHASIIQPFWQKYGAVAHWDFTDSSKLIEGATSTDVEGWKDSTPNNYNLSQPTASAQPTLTQPNGPLMFGGSDYLESNLTSLSGVFTVVFRIKSNSSSTQRILTNKSTFTNAGFGIVLVSGTDIIVRGDGASPQTQIALGNFVGSDMTIGVVYDNSNVEVYKDGIYQGSGTITDASANLSGVTVGSYTNGTSNFIGDMHAIQAYPTALNATQIANITAELNS